jgi:hypothetical protein
MDARILLAVLGVLGLIDAAIGVWMLNRAPVDPTRPPAAAAPNYALIGRLMLASAALLWLVAALIGLDVIPLDGLSHRPGTL